MKLDDPHVIARWVWIIREKETPNETRSKSEAKFQMLAPLYTKIGEHLVKRKPRKRSQAKSQIEKSSLQLTLEQMDKNAEISIDVETNPFFKRGIPQFSQEEENLLKRKATQREKTRIRVQRLRNAKKERCLEESSKTSMCYDTTASKKFFDCEE